MVRGGFCSERELTVVGFQDAREDHREREGILYREK